VSAKLTIPIPSEKFKLGAYGNVTFKTGNKGRGFTTDSNDITVLGLATIDLSDLQSFVPTRLHFNGGYRFNKNEDLGYGIFARLPDTSPTAGLSMPSTERFVQRQLDSTRRQFPAPSVTFFVEFDMRSSRT
jgi:hypothetical protein